MFLNVHYTSRRKHRVIYLVLITFLDVDQKQEIDLHDKSREYFARLYIHRCITYTCLSVYSCNIATNAFRNLRGLYYLAQIRL